MKTQHKSGLHPRNRHQTPYDFDALCQRTPELLPFVFVNEHGTRTLDFADPAAVKALNRALKEAQVESQRMIEATEAA